MSIRTKCPHCDRESIVAEESLSKRIRCKGCGQAFPVKRASTRPPSGEGSAFRSGSQPKAPAVSAPRSKSRLVAMDDDGSQPSNATLWIGLGGIAAATLLASIVAFVLIVNRNPPVARAPMPAPAETPVPPIALVARQPDIVAPPPVPQAPVPQPIDAPQPAPVDPPPAPPSPATDPPVAAAFDPANPYGDQGGESVEPAIPRANTMLRARSDFTFYRILAVHEKRSEGLPGEVKVLVDYEVVRRGTQHATSFAIRSSNGLRRLFSVPPPSPSGRGTFSFTRRGPVSPEGVIPADAEIYLVRSDRRFGLPAPQFKVSNSFVLGTMPSLMKARDWTADEIARFTKDPPATAWEPMANTNPDVGVETAFAGTADKGAPYRYVEPNGHVLGYEFRTGVPGGENCILQIRPLFRRDQRQSEPIQVWAKEGYAVAGVEVQYRNKIDAIRPYFRRIRPDRSLDPADAYQGEWFGAPDNRAIVMKLGNTAPTDNGPRVIGSYIRGVFGADGFALIVDNGS
jgi:hypothetical protein